MSLKSRFNFISALALIAQLAIQQAEAADLLFDLLPEKPLNPSILAVNAFVNDSRFGSISAQFNEVKETIHIKHVRVLMAWTTAVQPTPSANPSWGYYDQIVNSLPAGMDALIVFSDLPSWMSDSNNWIDNDPRKTLIKRWVRKVVKRYGKNKRVKGFQIWNEPNDAGNPDNILLDLYDSPENYAAMVQFAYPIIRKLAPKKKIVLAATTSINQNYPETFQYNEALKDAGVEQWIDCWAIHFYGAHLETLIFGGVTDFLDTVSKPIWVTESGAKGIDNQRSYAQKIWPYLTEQVSGIKRIYQYQFTEDTDASDTYGLKNLTPGSTVSDLYIYLRDLE